MTTQQKLDPLREFLDAVVTRIEALEVHCGIATKTGGAAPAPAMQKTPSVRHLAGTGDAPSLKAFDKFMNTTVYKLSDTCDSLDGTKDLGKLLSETFEGMRYVILLASKSKQPADMTELHAHLKPISDVVTKIRALRLSRDYDNHLKAVMEMLACVSWVTCQAPAQLPAPFVKECVGSSDFWSNRIRKEFKGKEGEVAENQLAFCDGLKNLLNELAAYITEHHKTGLTFNPKGVSLAEAAIRLSDSPLSDAAAAASRQQDQKSNKRASLMGNTVKGGNVAGMMAELAGRRSGDGSSAATGLKKVTKDMQTWRKEFKEPGKSKPAPVVVAPPAAKKEEKKKKKGLPILEYQERGTKWVIENQDKESAGPSGVLTVDVSDPKQQVYIFNCENVTVKINGNKLKSVIVDTCTKVNVVFETIISGCELVNSKRIAVQSDGVCPVFTIDKTVGVTVWLSEASTKVSSFTTSMSSEMNVNIPEGDDRKEMPIPEQFVHKLTGGSLSSEVSDLYH
eukprot:Nitzschia sp. Nitz4//scaffold117_size69655//25369//27079//NITZ4_006022-RA/size69655-augustus-gene-0.2-mRNA-1//1//CDS//3329533645//6198//frame0